MKEPSHGPWMHPGAAVGSTTMKTLVRSLAQVGAHQSSNLWQALTGRSVSAVGYAGMTLEADDVALVRRLLAQRDQWQSANALAQYQQDFATFNESATAFAFGSGREALSACLAALDLQPGDEVILPGYTCLVVPNALRFAGLQPVFVDIELQSYGLDVARVEQAITSKTRVLMLQHLYGLVSRDYEALLQLARAHNLRIIEDCSHATGARFQGKRLGNAADMAFYSSEQSKVFCSYMGGVATTNDAQLAQALQNAQQAAAGPEDAWVEQALYNVLLLYHENKDPQRWWRGDLAKLQYGEHRQASISPAELQGTQPAGYGRRMSPALAMLASQQLAKADRFNAQRRHQALHWDQVCQTKGYGKPLVLEDSEPVFLRYPVLVDAADKQDLQRSSKIFGVKPGQWFLGTTHPKHEPFSQCPNACEAVARCINLPTLMA